MRELISAAWDTLGVGWRLMSGLFLVGAVISLYGMAVDPSWVRAVDFVESVLVFLAVTALFVLLELCKYLSSKEVMFKPLTQLGADVMEGIAESETRSALVHIVGDSYMIEPVGVGNEHE